jgi:uncharacterized OsmC-like protein
MIRQSFCRSFAAPAISKATVINLQDTEWLGINKDGKSIVLSNGHKIAPSPSDAFLMAYGACAASGLKFLLEKRGKKVLKLETQVEGSWADGGQRKLDKICLRFNIDVPGVTQEELDKLVEICEAKMCPVAQTMRAGTLIKRVD